MTFSACINVLLVNIFLVVSGVLCSLFLCVFASLVESDSCFYDRLVIATFFNFCNNGRIWWLLTTGFPRLPTGQYWLGGCAAHNLSFHGYCLCSSAVVHMKISKIWIIVKINMLQVYGHTARMWVMDGVREEAWYKLLRENTYIISYLHFQCCFFPYFPNFVYIKHQVKGFPLLDALYKQNCRGKAWCYFGFLNKPLEP